MHQEILNTLKEHFPQYNDYKLGKIASDIEENIKPKNSSKKKYCVSCIFYPNLPTTYIGKAPNLCQKGLEKNNPQNCPYYCQGSSLTGDNYYSHISFKSITFK